jgi:hypothetical protein
MTDLTLTKIGMKSGVWQGLLSGDTAMPSVLVTHLEKPLPDVTVTPAQDKSSWLLKVPVPIEAVSDGVQTILITDRATQTRLGSFTLIAGEALGDDLRADVDLLRAELDLLKRAFRRHCVETTYQ